jgi:SAM-dependent methyltransferase
LLDDQLAGWFQSRTGHLVDGFQITAEDVVIDVGCGDGAAATAFIAAQGADVIATDVDPAVLEITKRKLQKSHARRYQTIVSDSDPLPIEDGRATRVVCMEVLEHVPDPPKFMAELVRVGRPGAKYLLTVPDPASESVQNGIAPDVYWQVPNHLRVFTRDGFASFVRESGLEVERQFFRGFYWAVWWTMFWACDQEYGDPEHPILRHWTESWHALISSPKGKQVKQALDAHLPKSQGIVAVKPAA